MTFQKKLKFFFLYAILLISFSCQSQSNKKNDTISIEKNNLSTGSEKLNNNQLQFSLVREFKSKEQFRKHRKLVRDIKISADKKSISYTYDGAKKQIQLKQPLQKNINTINISPKGEIFFAYSDGETASNNIFLYSLQGNLLKKLALNIYPFIRYSSNGKYITLANGFGNSFSFYNTTGDEIASFSNYQDLIKNNKSPLYLVDLAPDKESFLLRSDKLYLYSTVTGKLLWNKESLFIFNSLFLQDAIVLFCRNLNSPLRTLKLISRQDGSLISEIKDISKVSINEKNNILFSKDGKYFEYEIK